MPSARLSEVEYRCSFCGKSQKQVHRLIGGPAYVFICNECIQLCRDILDPEQSTTPQQTEAGVVPVAALLPGDHQQGAVEVTGELAAAVAALAARPPDQQRLAAAVLRALIAGLPD